MEPRDYTAAQKTLAELAAQREAARQALVKQQEAQLHTIWEREKLLSSEKWDMEGRQRDALQQLDASCKEKAAPHAELVAQGKRILTLMDIARRHPEPAAMGSVHTYRVEMPIFDTFRADDYKQIGVWIVPNGKPKNKFALIVRGWSLFAHNETLGLDKYRNSYVSGVNEKPHATIGATLREGPAEAELQAWYAKHKPGLITAYLVEHAMMEAPYREAQGLLDNPAWLRLYLEDRKDDYENRYSHGTEQPEYKAVLAELAALAAPAIVGGVRPDTGGPKGGHHDHAASPAHTRPMEGRG